ncbi:cation:proton antiporter [Shigella flexneri]
MDYGRSAATGSRELFTLSVLALALGIAFGAVELFDVSFALGAFFAGMVLNESELSHRAAHDTLPLRDAFAVLFFVSVGMLFESVSPDPAAVGSTGHAGDYSLVNPLPPCSWCACLVTLNARRSPSPPVWRKLVNLPLSWRVWEWR